MMDIADRRWGCEAADASVQPGARWRLAPSGVTAAITKPVRCR
jgi:hypothetical protein